VTIKTTSLAAALLASGAIALVLAAAAPAPAAAKSSREQWRKHEAAKSVREQRGKGLFWRLDPKLYYWQPRGHFGVDPGAYECFGYDCNW
jgi:hypothetical protein